jgi:hypothetical protein
MGQLHMISIFTNGIQSYKLIELPLAIALPQQFNMTDVSLIFFKKNVLAGEIVILWNIEYNNKNLKECKRTFVLAPKRGKISITGLISL